MMNYRQHENTVERPARALNKAQTFAVAPANCRAWARNINHQRKNIQLPFRCVFPERPHARGVCIDGDDSRSVRGSHHTEMARVGPNVEHSLRTKLLERASHKTFLGAQRLV